MDLQDKKRTLVRNGYTVTAHNVTSPDGRVFRSGSLRIDIEAAYDYFTGRAR